MTTERSTITRPLNGRFLAEIVTNGGTAEVAIVDRRAGEGSRARVAGAFTFLRSGDVIFDFANNPNGRESNIKYPDNNGEPDKSMAALVYAGATLQHPHTEDGTVGDIKVLTSEHTHPKVRENLGAIGVDFYASAQKPELDYGNPLQWAEDLPGISAQKIIYSLGGHFEPAA